MRLILFHDVQRDIPNLEFSPSHVSIGLSQIAFPIMVLPKDNRTDSFREERLGLPYWTMILANCVVVDRKLPGHRVRWASLVTHGQGTRLCGLDFFNSFTLFVVGAGTTQLVVWPFLTDLGQEEHGQSPCALVLSCWTGDSVGRLRRQWRQLVVRLNLLHVDTGSLLCQSR